MPQAPRSVRIRRSVMDAIVQHALEEAPVECCGLLLGRPDDILQHGRARNLRQSPVAFAIDPADHFAAIRSARRDGLSVVGAYHSHPRSPAVPSPTDIGEANDPELLHLIVSLTDREPVIAAFRIRDGHVADVMLVPVV